MAMNKRKKTTAIVAGVTAAALLLGGTFAWTSISQQAKNEAIVDINPGGRLHDDFDGTNKDVYVENFSSGATGVNIFARIRLDQYFEVGQDAGINKEAGDRKVTKPLGDNTDINDESTWVTYKPVVDEAGNIDLSNPIQANDNWQWTLGNEEDNLPYYMPTFNKNKDSLAADINGTYEGTVEDDIVHYDDFVKYGINTDENEVQSLTQNATYDWDEDTEDEENPSVIYDRNLPIDSADVLEEEETHEATQISTTATVISMTEWLALYNDDIEDNETGNFWVYDEDGWAYWAEPIEPGKTTGLLLDGINMSRVPDDNWYYGINVVGQFATASDWEMFFAPEDEGGAGETAMTEDAKQLMALITDTAASDDSNNFQTLMLTTEDTYEPVYIDFGESVNISTEDETADISDVKVYYFESTDVDADPTQVTLEKDTDYTYENNVLTILSESYVGEVLTVEDTTGTVSGYLAINEDQDSDYLSINYVAFDPEESGAIDLYYNQNGYLQPNHTLQLVPAARIDGVDETIVSDETTWSIKGNPDGITISENGLLSVADTVTGRQWVTVVLAYKHLTTEFDVYVSDKDITVNTSIEGNPGTYTTGELYQIQAQVLYGDEDITSEFTEWTYSVYNENLTEGQPYPVTYEDGTFYVYTPEIYNVSVHPKNLNAGLGINITVGGEQLYEPEYALKVKTGEGAYSDSIAKGTSQTVVVVDTANGNKEVAVKNVYANEDGITVTGSGSTWTVTVSADYEGETVTIYWSFADGSEDWTDLTVTQ